ncbi:MAG: ATP-binding protein [Deltaproteobacteria bacterium]|nr:ATP-binding protein [Deltaproteobacteria bacterium]
MSAPRRSLRADIVASFIVLLAALAVVGGYAVIRQSTTASQLRLINRRYLPLSVSLGRLYNNQDTMDVLLERAAVTRDPAARAWIQGARRARRSVISLARVEVRQALLESPPQADRVLLERVDQVLGTVERVYRESEPRFTAVLDALALGDQRSSARAYRELATHEQQALTSLRDAARQIEGRLTELGQEANTEQLKTLRLLVAATTIALGFGLITMLSARRALAPLALLIARVRAVAAGDLNPRSVVARDDEIGELAREFDGMVAAVRERDTELREGAERVRRAERELEQVVATLRTGVIVISSSGTIESANPAARRLASSQLCGESLEQSSLASMTSAIEAVHSVITTGESVARTSQAFLARSIDFAVAPFVAPGRSEQGALLVLDDVTEREQTRARLLQNERLAAIGRMAAHVTHEVRNPLTSLALNAEMLTDELDAIGSAASEAMRLVVSMQREVDRLTAITEEYLRVARLPSPRLEREDVAMLANEIGHFVRPEFSRAGVELRVDAPETALAMVDEAQLRQSLLNLLRNAREAVTSEATDSERPVILLSVRVTDERVFVSVEDSGRGVSDDVLPTLFELFVTTKEKGTGLGLALSKEIAIAHGGGIEVDAQTQGVGLGGARFTLWIPAASDMRASTAS